jgi:two-component system CheB/CheR fusion protein
LRSTIVPKVIEGSAGDDIRIWSAGCASGEESYSVAILFGEPVGTEAFRQRVKIYATDVDDEELTAARLASYSDKDIEELPRDTRDRYFDQVGGRWSFTKDLRRSVIFGRHDLLSDAPISRVDLLLCRNTLMYFHHEAQAKIVERFHYALREGGFLMLGKAEMLVNFTGMFAALYLKQRVFVKLRAETGADRLLTGYPDRDDRSAISGPLARLRDVSFDQDPTAQLVVDARGQLLMINARARELFGLTARDLGRPLRTRGRSSRPPTRNSSPPTRSSRRSTRSCASEAWTSRAATCFSPGSFAACRWR